MEEIEQWAATPLAEFQRPAAVIVVPETLAQNHAVLQLAAQPHLRAAGFLACAGLHPVQPQAPGTAARSVLLHELAPVMTLIETHASSIAAIGETGLDFTPALLNASLESAAAAIDEASTDEASTKHKHSDESLFEFIKSVQRKCFQAHIDASNRLGIPLNVHSRGAGHHAVTQLIESQNKTAVLHAFDGRATYALNAAQNGLYLSVPPCVVRSDVMKAWVKQVPLDSLVLETDAPALPSIKGMRNSVLNCHESLKAVADIKGLDIDTVASITTENAKKLFPAVRRHLDSLNDQRHHL
eukprot:jgi/Hompol1/5050/HPOL_001874-RA